VAAIALAPMTPIPWMVCSRLLASLARCCTISHFSIEPISVCSACNDGVPAFLLFGGTSSGSPQWAALIADADQMAHHDIGNINDNLYRFALIPRLYHSVFNDVTLGNNDVADLGGAGFNAGPGWDPVTGLGTPRAQNLLPALALTSGH